MCSERIGNKNGNRDYYKLPISPKLFSLCSRDVSTAQTKKFWTSWQTFGNFIVCAVETFKTLLFVQSRHSKLYCLCSRDIQNFIVCAVETFKTLLFGQSRHSKLYCLCSRAIRNFLVCVSLLGLRTDLYFNLNLNTSKNHSNSLLKIVTCNFALVNFNYSECRE